MSKMNINALYVDTKIQQMLFIWSIFLIKIMKNFWEWEKEY